MPIPITFKADVSELVREIDRFGADAPKAEARALTNTMKAVQRFTVDRLAEVTGVDLATIGKRVEVVKATPDRLQADLVVSGQRIPAIKYGATEDITGVTYQSPIRGPVSIRHAFIAATRSGHVGVFRRARGGAFSRRHNTRATPSGLVGRLPIREMLGPSLASVFEQPPIVQPVIEEAERALKENLEKELDALTRTAGR
jgi:hypothetical protein